MRRSRSYSARALSQFTIPDSCLTTHVLRAAELADVDGRSNFDEVVQFFDVGDRHPDAAVGGGAAERFGLFGAVVLGRYIPRFAPHRPRSLL